MVSEATFAVSRAQVHGHEHGRVVADAKACGRVCARHGHRTGTVGTGRTDVAHGTVSTRRMVRGQERRSWYLGWSGTRRGRRVLRGMIVTAMGTVSDGSHGNSVGPVL